MEYVNIDMDMKISVVHGSRVNITIDSKMNIDIRIILIHEDNSSDEKVIFDERVKKSMNSTFV